MHHHNVTDNVIQSIILLPSTDSGHPTKAITNHSYSRTTESQVLTYQHEEAQVKHLLKFTTHGFLQMLRFSLSHRSAGEVEDLLAKSKYTAFAMRVTAMPFDKIDEETQERLPTSKPHMDPMCEDEERYCSEQRTITWRSYS